MVDKLASPTKGRMLLRMPVCIYVDVCVGVQADSIKEFLPLSTVILSASL